MGRISPRILVAEPCTYRKMHFSWFYLELFDQFKIKYYYRNVFLPIFTVMIYEEFRSVKYTFSIRTSKILMRLNVLIF